MAITGAAVLDGTYSKIVDITTDAPAVDTTQVFTFVGLGMTAFNAHNGVPLDMTITPTSAGYTVATDWGVSGVTAAGFTINRIAGAGTSTTARVRFDVIQAVNR